MSEKAIVTVRDCADCEGEVAKIQREAGDDKMDVIYLDDAPDDFVRSLSNCLVDNEEPFGMPIKVEKSGDSILYCEVVVEKDGPF